MSTIVTLNSALDILRAANQRSKRVRDAQRMLRKQILDYPVCWDNFHDATEAVFRPIERVPSRKPDFVSRSGSLYWDVDQAYSDGSGFHGVIRMSNHWGIGIRSCDWYLNSTYGDFASLANNYELERGIFVVAICAYEEFKKKSRVLP